MGILIPSLSCYNIYPHPSQKSVARIFYVDSAAAVLKLTKTITRFFRCFHFSLFFDAYLHLTVMIACLRLDSQFIAVNFCAQAADLVSTFFPI